MAVTALSELRARVEALDATVARREATLAERQVHLDAARRDLAEALDLRDQYDEVIAQVEQDTRVRSAWLAPVVILDSRRPEPAPMARSGGNGDVLYGAA